MLKRGTQIVIAGAGPAGSSLAIRLALCGHRVVLIERESFPRQKLCGEFISPECLSHFEELGVLDEMLVSGGDRVVETKFYDARGRCVSVPSKWFRAGNFALSLSRARMDHILLEQVRRVGVEVLEETTVVGLLKDKDRILGVEIRYGDGRRSNVESALTIDATGRARVLTKLDLKTSASHAEPKPKFVGFKAHLAPVRMPAGVCEIYAFRGGYAGLSFVENSEANLCFLAKASELKEHETADGLLQQIMLQNARASRTLASAIKVHDWLAVSVPAFGRHRQPLTPGLYSVGDSAAFIDPFTGSGMLMAMESAEVFAGCVERSSDFGQLGSIYSADYHRRFRSRLRVSGAIRRIAYNPALGSLAIRLLSMGDRPRAVLARLTRSTPLGQV